MVPKENYGKERWSWKWRYYGDENLQKLIEHSRELINDFVDFQARHFDVEVVEEEEQEEDQAEEQEEGLHEEKT